MRTLSNQLDVCRSDGSLITIDGVGVQRDADGRFCINDLHKASGEEKRHQPSNWTALQQTKELIDEVSIPGIPGIVTKQGVGTFVAKELVYAYAMWVSPKFHLNVIRTFDKISSLKGPEQALSMAESAVRAAVAFGFEGNQAVLSANRVVQTFTGVNLLEAMGAKQLVAPEQVALLTASDLAVRLGVRKLSVNPLLIARGLQTSHRDASGRLYYEPTDTGAEYCVVLDTGKKGEHGVPVRQLKWKSSVIKLLTDSCEGSYHDD